MFYPEGFANFALDCDVYEHGKLGISVNTSLIMALFLTVKCVKTLKDFFLKVPR